MPRRHRELAFHALLLLAVALGGCATTLSVQPIPAATLEAVEAHRSAVVLFQIRATLDGRPLSLANPGYDTSGDNFFRLYLARLDGLEAPVRVRPASPSEAAAAEGWHYLVLPAGVYYLLVLPPGTSQGNVLYDASTAKFGRIPDGIQTSDRISASSFSPELFAWVWLKDVPRKGFSELPGFWFEVPEHQQGVYLGSLSVACSTRRGLLGSMLGPCDDLGWTTDPQSAQRVLASLLPRATVHESPLVLNGRRRPGTPAGGAPLPDVVLPAPGGTGVHFRGGAEVRQSIAPVTGTTLFRAAEGSLSLTQPSDIGDVPLGLLLFPMVKAIEQHAQADAEQRRDAAQACIDRLSEVARQFDYAATFAAALRAAVGSSSPASDQATVAGRSRLTASVPVLRLREFEPKQAALELALQIRHEAAEPPSTRYYAVLYYGPPSLSNPLAPGSLVLYAQVLSERPKPRPIEEWCGPDGAALLADEISAALKLMAVQVGRALE